MSWVLSVYESVLASLLALYLGVMSMTTVARRRNVLTSKPSEFCTWEWSLISVQDQRIAYTLPSDVAVDSACLCDVCVCVCVSMCVSVPVCVSVWLCVCLNVRLWKEKTLSREKPHRKNKSAMSSGRKLWWRTKNVHGLDLDIDLQEMVRTLFANFPNKLC